MFLSLLTIRNTESHTTQPCLPSDLISLPSPACHQVQLRQPPFLFFELKSNFFPAPGPLHLTFIFFTGNNILLVPDGAHCFSSFRSRHDCYLLSKVVTVPPSQSGPTSGLYLTGHPIYCLNEYLKLSEIIICFLFACVFADLSTKMSGPWGQGVIVFTAVCPELRRGPP